MKREIPLKEKVAYTGGLLGQNMIYNFMIMYGMFFFTDLLGVSSKIATVIFVVASLWDAVNDPMMGVVADRTRTKFGKFKPYMMFGPIIIIITSMLVFVDFNFNATLTAIVAGACYILWGMSYTLCDIPIWAVTSTVSTIPEERTLMVTLGKIGGTIGTVIVTVGSMPLIYAIAGDMAVSSYTISAAIFVIFGGILMMLSGITIKERIKPDKEVISIKKNLKTITSNKPLKALMIALVITNLVNAVRQASQVYFVKYVWEDSLLVTPIGISLVVGMTLGMVVAPILAKRFSKRKVFFLASAFGSIVSVVPMFAQENVTLALIFLGMSFFATGIITIICATMLLDAIEFSEWKLGYRGEGIIFSINTFLTKLSATFAKLILGVALIIVSYTENMTPTPMLQSSLCVLMYVIPAISFLVSMIPMIFYKLTNEECAEIHQKLEENRKVEEV